MPVPTLKKMNPEPSARRAKRATIQSAAPEQTTSDAQSISQKRRPFSSWLYPLLVLASFLLGILSSYMAWGHKTQSTASDLQPLVASTVASSSSGNGIDMVALMKEISPTNGYKLPVNYGNLGPHLLESGVINYDAFAAIYKASGNPLTPAQVDVLKKGSDEPVVITPDNSYYLLNFFWAVGLANKNPILTEGSITQYSKGQIDRFASTGGWTLGTKPVKDLFASSELITLTSEEQARLEQVASAVYRPCCDNPTLFPDCNHGMAMLGLLELMASNGASVDEMFTAAKYINAYWFPQQTLQTAIYLKANQAVDFAQADPHIVTSKDLFSATGSGNIYASLQSRGLLPKSSDSGGNCGS